MFVLSMFFLSMFLLLLASMLVYHVRINKTWGVEAGRGGLTLVLTHATTDTIGTPTGDEAPLALSQQFWRREMSVCCVRPKEYFGTGNQGERFVMTFPCREVVYCLICYLACKTTCCVDRAFHRETSRKTNGG